MSLTSSDGSTQDSEENELFVMPTILNHMKRHFLCPAEDENRLRYCVKALAVTLYYSSVGACCVGYIYDIKRRGVNIGYEGDVAAATSLFCQTFLLLVWIIKQPDILRLLKELKTFGQFGLPTDFDDTEHKMKLLTNFIYFGTICGVVTYEFVPLFEISRCEEYNKLQNQHEVCGLNAPIWSILHIESLPMTHIYFIYQVTALLSGMPAVALFPILGYGLHEHMVTRINHLKEKLEIWGEEKIITRDMLREFVMHHIYIIRLMESVERITSIPLCVHVFFTSTVVTLTLHQIINLTWRTPGGPLMHMFTWLIIIFINSLGGQRIKDESTSIGIRIYNKLNWYETDVDIQKDLLLIICRSQKALVASTGAFGCMDLSLLLTVMKGFFTFCLVSIWQSTLQ